MSICSLLIVRVSTTTSDSFRKNLNCYTHVVCALGPFAYPQGANYIKLPFPKVSCIVVRDSRCSRYIVLAFKRGVRGRNIYCMPNYLWGQLSKVLLMWLATRCFSFYCYTLQTWRRFFNTHALTFLVHRRCHLANIHVWRTDSGTQLRRL